MMGARRASALMEFSSAESSAREREKSQSSVPGSGRTGLSRRCFDLRQRPGDLRQIRDYGNVVILEPRHFARFVDDGDRAAGDSFVSQEHAILFAHGAARMKV